MMSKYKVDDAPEVFSARSKLDGVLQTLVEQKEEGLSPEKDSFPRLDADADFIDSPLSSPSKRSPRIGKAHRKRKYDKDDKIQTEAGQLHHTYIMKLFDRSVDLAQFSEDTPLYPVCRAWIRNQPNNLTFLSQNKTEEPETERESGCVYELPKPIAIKSENGHSVNLRIPSPVPQPDDTLDINADTIAVDAPEYLLLNHMIRWKQVRQKWKNAARTNEMQHAKSLNILREMFEKQCRDQ